MTLDTATRSCLKFASPAFSLVAHAYVDELVAVNSAEPGKDMVRLQ